MEFFVVSLDAGDQYNTYYAFSSSRDEAVEAARNALGIPDAAVQSVHGPLLVEDGDVLAGQEDAYEGSY